MMLVIICGLPGTGKSMLAKHLSRDINGKILRTDIIRGELFQESTVEEVMNSNDPMQYNLEKIFDKQEAILEEYQQMIWRQKEIVYDELLHRTENMLREGETVILDGTFYSKSLREKVYNTAGKVTARVYLIECRCSEGTIEERLTRRKQSPHELSSVDKMQIYWTVKNFYESPVSDSIPLIVYDTGAQRIKTYNVMGVDKGFAIIVTSIRKLIKKVRLGFSYSCVAKS